MHLISRAILCLKEVVFVVEGPRILAPTLAGPISPAMRSPQPTGAPIFLPTHAAAMQRFGLAQHGTSVSASQAAAVQQLASIGSVANTGFFNAGQAAPLMSHADAGLLYAAADPYAALAANSMFELQGGLDPSNAGTSAYVR